MTEPDPLMTADEVMAELNIGKSAFFDWIANGKFPAPLRLSPQCVRWRTSEVQHWINTRPRTREPKKAA